ncbi:NADP-specific glutamate dehydrogenase [Cyclobacterium marinum]|uniref:Glutamate dehydrogenase n=1 Tax=Cyclobacterium marinum (strain ATCC 25205 / DSM 745 / LMG 13164 / NCIMB 1802) TaxID=880070 RepID=G0J598_CYCMS|nr:NADP-specific glutamate dehydrogenase [Cyclobacterium marinum]AEL26782.1 Glu/Leu/Phe/Val dehydrogenase [Cyclobacterium marinum DSM 745]|tara:strand:- start:19850 stop:21199 length:1350 start_codon:yes stop_codon:yes gene_type:complete
MSSLKNILKNIIDKNPNESEFHQAVQEVFESILPVLNAHDLYVDEKLFERICEAERIISFRVCWTDDNGKVQVNKGYRIQMNSALGPYKGGLRFHPSVNQSILKFLAFEQIFKNALTGLPLGAGKGGADFNPKGKSDGEVMRFCQAWMMEAYRHIGHFTDVPAGDIGVGEREIGYLFGTYKKIQNEFQGVLTGKGKDWGGSFLRPEATGYGLIHFAHFMLTEIDEHLNDKVCLVSGAGNVSQFAIEKLLQEGAKVVAFSDSTGFIHDPEGMTEEKLDFLKTVKNGQRKSISAFAEKFESAKFTTAGNENIWSIPADCAFPCATQNELHEADAKLLKQNGLLLLAEGANMPCTPEAINYLQQTNVLYGPGKASNAGGVAVSGLEMTQNRMGSYWTKNDLEKQLRTIMKGIHEKCLETISKHNLEKQDYLNAANIGAFEKVAKAMHAQGTV